MYIFICKLGHFSPLDISAVLPAQLPRDPTLGEISYDLAEITEIKLEIVKSQAHLKSEISPQQASFS